MEKSNGGVRQHQQQHAFGFERYDVYRLAVEVNRWFASVKMPHGRSHLRDQGMRAADSVVCNIAEGIAKGPRGRAGRNSLCIALGEAGELCAVLDCAAVPGGLEAQRKLRRVGAMLSKMTR